MLNIELLKMNLEKSVILKFVSENENGVTFEEILGYLEKKISVVTTVGVLVVVASLGNEGLLSKDGNRYFITDSGLCFLEKFYTGLEEFEEFFKYKPKGE